MGVWRMKKVRLGIIGIGRIGSNHARVAAGLNQIELVGYCDLLKSKADSAANKYGVKAFYDYRQMLDLVDAVIIAVQTEFHYEIAKYFIMNGKHVLVEKPITISLNDGISLVNLAREYNVLLAVGHIERFNAAIVELENIVSNKDVVGLSVKRMSPMDHRVKDIDVVLDLMIHDIDIVLNFMKPYKIKNITAMKNIVKDESKQTNHADYCVAQLLFDNGTIADLTASRVTDKKIRSLVINDLDKFIEVDYLNKKVTVNRNFTAKFEDGLMKNKNAKYQEEAIVQSVFVNNVDSMHEEDQNFINAILGLDKLKVTGEDGIRALKVAKQIQQIIY